MPPRRESSSGEQQGGDDEPEPTAGNFQVELDGKPQRQLLLLSDYVTTANVSNATFDAADATVRCVSPPAITGAAGPASLFLSLNGQNYEPAGGLVFHYTEPLVPTLLSPTSGPGM